MLDRFSSCAANALALARDEARLLAHAYVGTEHLLIGLAREERGAASRVLASLDLTADQLRESIVFIGGRGESGPPSDDPPLTPRLERVLEAAEKEASRRQQTQVATLHLLLALVREREGIAVMLLEVPGVALERIGGAMMRALREGLADEA
ncbi:MAG TPA: Clp protease N-terminal domain-containing protein [Thermomicrobiales bacterium]|nr:Clp protease N-terminal domain-containing protein [Thermomicrobiales bacterium]